VSDTQQQSDRPVLAIDFGTTNTVLGRWMGEDATIINLGDCCRMLQPEGIALTPSCLLLLDSRGTSALIGREALAQDGTRRRIVRRFKPRLAEDGTTAVHMVGGKSITAREAARLFITGALEAYREVMEDDFREVVRGHFIFRRREVICPRLVIPAPVDYFETYREELRTIVADLGYDDVLFIDEPLAAALGMAVEVERQQYVMAIDFGGGTCDVAVVQVDADSMHNGRSRAVTKCGEDLGGDLIDYWLMDEICRRSGVNLQDLQHIRGPLKDAAERLKIALSQDLSAEVSVYDDRSDRTLTLKLSRAEFEQILADRGIFERLGAIIERALRQASSRGVDEEAIETVLLVGGSTEIPSVRTFIENRFGRERVRSRGPFTAVARGAAAFGAGARVVDLLQHDYGVRVSRPKQWDAAKYVDIPDDEEHAVQLLLHSGERCPTGEVVQTYDTGGLGGVQREFHVRFYEIARDGSLSLVINPDTGLPEEQRETRLRPLNIEDPAVCRLDPPSREAEKRVQIAYRVDEARWLRITVQDLRAEETLIEDRPVVQLRR
jgi:molecular chaperone DnaK (HSP70)